MNVLDLLQIVLALIVTLGILVTVHEYGHFLIARRCGVRVLKFSVGMGPNLWSRRGRDGVEYAIAALPIGGYVRMLDSRETDVPDAQRHEAFDAKPPGQRIAIALGGPVANFLLAIVVYWLVQVTGTSGLAPMVHDVDADSPAGRAGVPVDVEIVAVDGQATATWQAVNMALVERLGETGAIAFDVRPLDGGSERRVEVPIDRWLADAGEPDPLGDLGLRPTLPAILGEVMDDGAAAAGGLRDGDRVLAVDGEPLLRWSQWVEAVQAAPGETLSVTVRRDGRETTVDVTPEARTGNDGTTIGFVGTSPASPTWRTARFGPLEAVPVALAETRDKTLLTLEILAKMIDGRVSTSNLSGPITIAKVAGDSAESGLETFLSFLALLSVSLAVLNLLPIPVLDGGHILFYLVELVKGSPVPERVQVLGVQIGIFIVASLMLLALYNDLTRL